VPRRIEEPSADTHLGQPPPRNPATGPREAAPRRPATGARPARPGRRRAEPSPPEIAPRRRRPAAPRRVDEGMLRRLDQLEAVLGDLPVDGLIELREALEVLLAADSVDAAALHRLLEVSGG
jgi:hypothetical protein